MAESKGDSQAMTQPESDLSHIDVGEDVIARVEAFLDKLANYDTTEGICGDSASSLAENLGGMGLSQAEGGAKPKTFALPVNTPPFSDFVPKVGRSLDRQELEHDRRKQEQIQKMNLKEKLANKDEFADEEDSVAEGNEAGETPTESDQDADTALLEAQMNSPTLTELIFGEAPNFSGLEAEYNPTRLGQLFEHILPKDGAFVEEEGIPIPQDNSTVTLEPSKTLAPDKLKILHEMLGLYGSSG